MNTGGEMAAPRGTAGKSRVRWWIVWTLFFSTVTNYISRQTFSVLAPLITAQYHFTHTDLSRILGAFQLSYALTWLLGGIFLDAVGTRAGLAVAVVFWSVVNIFTGFATSVAGFAAFRFLLGIGEGFNWPGASKTVAEWFPRQERSLAVAIFDSGSSIGGAIAALAIPLIAIRFGWRSAFFCSGGLGFVWLLLWLRVYHPLGRHPRVSAEEVGLILAGCTVDLSGTRHPSLAQAAARPQRVGHRARPRPHRSYLVVLRVLASTVSERCARIQPAPDCAVRVDAVHGRGHRQLHWRLDLGLLHSPRHVVAARAHLGLRRELSTDSRRHSRSDRAQCLSGAGPDLRGFVGLRELVNDGAHLAF
jgi:nitrate/nitrite transporter NarK